jgi:hypothetical protein
MSRFILTAFAVTALAACHPANTEMTEEQKAEIAAEVRAFGEAYIAAFPELNATH